MSDSRSVRQYLRLLSSSGITHLPEVTLPKPRPAGQLRRKPGSSTERTPRPPKRPAGPKQTTEKFELRADAVAAPTQSDETLEILSRPLTTAEEKSDALCALAQVVDSCRRCTELADSRRRTVFGVGNPNADIMFIGEAPGADEDRQGEPFVGAAGKLLNKIISACGLKREDIYICNILRCRPPGNRNPLPQEAVNCREYLDGQIRIVDPDYIICWGTVAAQNLLSETRSVGRMRGQFMQHGRAKVLCTYHPSYLLRNASAKKLVWEDMKVFMAEAGLQQP